MFISILIYVINLSSTFLLNIMSLSFSVTTCLHECLEFLLVLSLFSWKIVYLNMTLNRDTCWILVILFISSYFASFLGLAVGLFSSSVGWLMLFRQSFWRFLKCDIRWLVPFSYLNELGGRVGLVSEERGVSKRFFFHLKTCVDEVRLVHNRECRDSFFLRISQYTTLQYVEKAVNS